MVYKNSNFRIFLILFVFLINNWISFIVLMLVLIVVENLSFGLNDCGCYLVK